MSSANKQLIRQSIKKIWEYGNLDSIDDFFAADYVSHFIPPEYPTGREGLRRFIAFYLQGLSDLDIHISEQVAEGDLVTTRYTSSGKHTGELFGIPATGKRVRISGITITHVIAGKIVEDWAEYDQLGIMRQLGGLTKH